ncbi:MAG: ATP synthase F1 subunit delta [Candidatus Eisenbacteria bacterium]|uniref:ATP synthase subunit delta n=1 Tax=Eiseniibacteriota bacterium TaxID=2212470 RepID=A0A538U465_UNCEI|nr:MAG: ATP synthase F1 subunit delta [Candidatus Eisenbacteria bacterium]
MRDTTVAARYAKGLFILTEKRGETVRALEDLRLLIDVLKHGSRVGNFLASPGVRAADKREALQRGLGDKVTRTVVLFIDLLLRKKRLNEFDPIVTEFEALVEKAQGIQRAHVVSAVPLTDSESGRLHAELERRTHSKIRLTSEVDPRLIGGALVRIGDHVVDRSVATLLKSIERQLSEVTV